jgi:hypothetical protein
VLRHAQSVSSDVPHCRSNACRFLVGQALDESETGLRPDRVV